MKILVTGGAGFIGSHLVNKLCEDHKVIVLDDLSVGKRANVNPKADFVLGSILDEGLVKLLVGSVDYVYHLAAVVGIPYIMANPCNGILVNSHGAANVLRGAFKEDKGILFTSTSEVYGKSREVPFAEDDDMVVGRSSRWSYSLAKALDEQLAMGYYQKGLRVAIVRYFNSYGPGLNSNGYGSVIAKFITQALRGDPITVYDDGLQSRCFTYINDTIKGTLMAAETSGQIFNIGNNKKTAILSLANLIKEMANSQSEIIFIPGTEAYGSDYEDTFCRVPDISKAKEILGFEAHTPLSIGLEKTINWFKSELD